MDNNKTGSYMQLIWTYGFGIQGRSSGKTRHVQQLILPSMFRLTIVFTVLKKNPTYGYTGVGALHGASLPSCAPC